MKEHVGGKLQSKFFFCSLIVTFMKLLSLGEVLLELCVEEIVVLSVVLQGLLQLPRIVPIRAS